MDTKNKAVIIGGGIAGLSVAFWLDKAGWESVIIERAQTIRGGGFLIGLTGLGYESAKHMDLVDPLNKVSYDLNENVMKTSSGSEIVRLKYTDAHGLESIALQRGDLAKTLAEAVPESATIRLGRTMANFVDNRDSVNVTLDNGETLKCDLLIGADGIHSHVRTQLFKDMDTTPLADLGYSFAVYDVEGDPETELEASCVSYTRPGHLDCFYRLRDRRIAVLHMWRDEFPKLEVLRNENGKAAYERLHAIAAGGHPKIREFVNRSEAAGAPILVDTMTMVKMPTWSQGRVTLLGDAAHCLTLMSGQGAAMAMASAEILGRELKNSNNDVVAALAAHDKCLRPAILRLQDHSTNLAAAYIPRNAFIYHLRNWMIRLIPYSWLISWHSEKIKAENELTKL
ncbi:hypothetical protein SCUCBS95973_004129 [Sporothrix curviconia]|uniref:FAD-binding domain-containing protein n=1 Tax=Sporothrix curviconia TaxID=1260050 RepID=A0ABP0BLN4_9PEZI